MNSDLRGRRSVGLENARVGILDGGRENGNGRWKMILHQGSSRTPLIPDSHAIGLSRDLHSCQSFIECVLIYLICLSEDPVNAPTRLIACHGFLVAGEEHLHDASDRDFIFGCHVDEVFVLLKRTMESTRKNQDRLEEHGGR
jgi:hypothetical protein